jgi:aminopeptidase YwaD
MKFSYFLISFFVSLCCGFITKAQFKENAKPILDSLCSPAMCGRGYVNNGVNKAADYLAREFNKVGLKHFDDDYFQNYLIDVNTIQKVTCKLDGITFEAGDKFLVEADCPSFSGKFKILPFSITNEVDLTLLNLKLNIGFEPNEALLIKNAEDREALKKLKQNIAQLKKTLPLIIYSSSKKLLWTVAESASNQPSLTFPDTIISQADEIEISVESKAIRNFNCKNLIGYVPAKSIATKRNKKAVTKECVVFSAHYDHLGMMGEKAYFPGASDNASGISMLLNLAKYYKNNPQNVNIVFLLFSGEEAGLKGSEYYVSNPIFPLENIKFLINVDIMGNAEAGITVVNGEKEKKAFDQLVAINKEKKYIPEVKIRGKAANSDHYHFSESNVPAIFIFSNGGVGFYHDVWDKPNTISLANYDGVAKLLIDFVGQW